MSNIAAFVIARNEERSIEDTLTSLQKQTHEISYLVVVNDGSTDKTQDIIDSYNCDHVNLPPHDESYVGRPELAQVCNFGLKEIMQNVYPDYVLQMGGDHILPSHYVETLLNRMGEKVKIASGTCEGFKLQPDVPLGTGRLIDAKLWKKINGMVYPLKYGYESWLVYKIRKLGYEVKRYDDLLSVTRDIRMNPSKAFEWGRCTYALGGATLFANVKALGMGLNGYHFLRGYYSRKGVEKHMDIAEYVKKQQYSRLSAKLKLRRSIPTPQFCEDTDKEE